MKTITMANFITLARLLSVPAIVYALLVGEMEFAFGLFVAASLSDALDGFIARYFEQPTELGSYLDPVADKLLLGSVFIMLGFIGALPLWLVVMVISRDLLIVAAVLVSSLMYQPVKVRPIAVSKANTAFQIALAVAVLAELSFDFSLGDINDMLAGVVALLTGLSAAAYLSDWLRHISDVHEHDERGGT